MATLNDPTAQPFNEAQMGAEDQKRRTLAAMAQAGDAGKQAITDAQARITNDKQRALAQALTESRQFNAPADVQQQVSGTISDPYDLRNTSLTQGQANREADNSYRGASAEDFFNRIIAGIPLAQTQAKSRYDLAVQRSDAAKAAAAAAAQQEWQIAQMKLQAEAEARQQASDLAERQFEQDASLAQQKFDWQMQLAQAKAAPSAAGRSSGGGGGGGGGGSSGGYFNLPTNKTETSDALKGYLPAPALTGGIGDVVSRAGQTVAANKLGAQLGLPPGVAAGLVSPKPVAQNPLLPNIGKAKPAPDKTSGQQYQDALSYIAELKSDPSTKWSKSEIVQAVKAYYGTGSEVTNALKDAGLV